MLLRGLIASLLLFFAAITQAEDCLVSTLPPERLASLPQIKAATNNDELGLYHVAFTNGDQILAHYGTCELALNAHYLLRQTSEPEFQQIAEYLAALVPSKARGPELVAQLNSSQALALNRPLQLKGAADDAHVLTLKSATSPLFAFELHYQWLPPLH